jgi:rRNA maturation endonuclease Nob1
LDVIAIAINSNETLYTDDYSMQNVCRFLGLDFQPVFNQKSKKQWFWQLKCIGCRATKEIEIEKEEICEICGSPMKVKKARR